MLKSSAEAYREEQDRMVTVGYEDDTMVEVRVLTRNGLIVSEAASIRRTWAPMLRRAGSAIMIGAPRYPDQIQLTSKNGNAFLILAPYRRRSATRSAHEDAVSRLHQERIASFEPSAVMGSTQRYLSIARSDLAAVIYGALEDRVELIMDDTVSALDDDGKRGCVRFESGGTRDFDLVVGADGLHSQVRRLAFGPDEQFERYLHIVVSAFDVEGYRPRDELIAMMYAEVGFQAVRLSLRDDVTMFLLTVRHDAHVPTDDLADQQALLRARLADAGWETPAILDLMPQARTFYFDSVSQIRMPSWTRGRVALVGDAAACPSRWPGRGPRWRWWRPTYWPRN